MNKNHSCYKKLRLKIQVFISIRTLSGPSCSFQDHIYVGMVLESSLSWNKPTNHQKRYHNTSTYKLHIKISTNIEKICIFLEALNWKIPDFLGIFRKMPIFLCSVNFSQNFQENSIFLEIFQKSSFSFNFGKNRDILDRYNIFFMIF